MRYVLEGSVRRSGNHVRVTGQLIETENATHVWADRYDSTLSDIFALQDEMTMNVIGAVEPTLRKAEVERARRKRPDNLDAYDLFLRALPSPQPQCRKTRTKRSPCWKRRSAWSRIMPLSMGSSLGATSSVTYVGDCTPKRGRLLANMPTRPLRPEATMPWR